MFPPCGHPRRWHTLKTRNQAAGKTVPCPHCGTSLLVPSEDSSDTDDESEMAERSVLADIEGETALEKLAFIHRRIRRLRWRQPSVKVRPGVFDKSKRHGAHRAAKSS
jgi:hypothetical protein